MFIACIQTTGNRGDGRGNERNREKERERERERGERERWRERERRGGGNDILMSAGNQFSESKKNISTDKIIKKWAHKKKIGKLPGNEWSTPSGEYS